MCFIVAPGARSGCVISFCMQFWAFRAAVGKSVGLDPSTRARFTGRYGGGCRNGWKRRMGGEEGGGGGEKGEREKKKKKKNKKIGVSFFDFCTFFDLKVQVQNKTKKYARTKRYPVRDSCQLHTCSPPLLLLQVGNIVRLGMPCIPMLMRPNIRLFCKA